MPMHTILKTCGLFDERGEQKDLVRYFYFNKEDVFDG